jgi:hypothetical protein
MFPITDMVDVFNELERRRKEKEAQERQEQLRHNPWLRRLDPEMARFYAPQAAVQAARQTPAPDHPRKWLSVSWQTISTSLQRSL